jgi:transposase-like protein
LNLFRCLAPFAHPSGWCSVAEYYWRSVAAIPWCTFSRELTGSTGFRAAYENVYWMTPLQRCVFHKLRNLAQAIKPPAALDRQAAKAYRTNLLRSAAQIWQATDELEAQQSYTDFCLTWQTQQPKAVKILSKDFELTLTFFAVQEQAAALGEDWPAHHLRTTSPLERLFRDFRQRFRSAVLFHSPAGLIAVTQQLAVRFS